VRSKPMEPRDLTAVLKNATPGEWVALSMDRTRIVGQGKTAQDARKAASAAGEREVILLLVPFPNVGIAASTQ